MLRAVVILVGGLGHVRVQPDLPFPGELDRFGQQPAGNGERRARPDRDPEHGLRRGVVIRPDRGLGCRQDLVGVLDDLVRRQPAGAAPEVHRAAVGMKPQPDRPGRLDRGGEQVAAGPREDVMVVGRRGAPGPGQPGEGG